MGAGCIGALGIQRQQLKLLKKFREESGFSRFRHQPIRGWPAIPRLTTTMG